MKRTKFNTNTNPISPALLTRYQNLMTMGAIANRAQLAARFGSQYGGDRKIYQALGYPTDIPYEDYLARYTRQDIAKAVINRPISQTWKGQVNITETDTKEETTLEKAWKALDKQLKLQSKFVRLDKVSSIGQYGILLLGFDDTEKQEDFAKPVLENGKRKLLYVKPLGEGHALVKTYVKDTKNERYGMPEMYEVTFSNPDDSSTTSFKLHYTRALHVTTELLESEVEGEPVLKAIWNRLMDLEKLTGGSAEMFWRGARPGYQGKIDKDFMMTPEQEQDLEDQLDEYEHNLRRFLMNEGVEYTALEAQVSDPSKHVDIQIQMISALTGIPKRILTGSERGELSSEQDLTGWYNVIQTRREEHAEPNIVRPFVDLMIKYKVLPAPKGNPEEGYDYQVEWTDLFSASDKEKAEIGKTRAEALKAYAANPSAELVVPPEAFLEYFLGLDADQMEYITELMKAAMAEEERAIREAEATQPTPPQEEEVVEEEPEEIEQT